MTFSFYLHPEILPLWRSLVVVAGRTCSGQGTSGVEFLKIHRFKKSDKVGENDEV